MLRLSIWAPDVAAEEELRTATFRTRGISTRLTFEGANASLFGFDWPKSAIEGGDRWVDYIRFHTWLEQTFTIRLLSTIDWLIKVNLQSIALIASDR